MELSTETPPSVLKIASMFASLSAQHRRVDFAKGTNVNGGRRSIESAGETFRTLNANASSTTKSAVFYSDRTTIENNNGNRTRSRSSDSRPACLDLKVIDNRTKFDHAKALFESLERQSRQEQRHRTPHNNKKRVASPSPTRASSAVRNDQLHQHQQVSVVVSEATAISSTNSSSNACTTIRAGPPALRTVTIAKRDQQISSPAPTPPNSSYSCVVTSETATFTAMNVGGCSTTTITSTTRLISNAPSPANNIKMSAVVPTPPPVPPKPKLIDSPRTSSESSSTATSPSQFVAKAVFQRAWTLESANSTPAKNGINEKPHGTLMKEETSSLDEKDGRIDADNSHEHLDKMNSTKVETVVRPGGPVRNYYTRITQQRRTEMENNGSTAVTWSSTMPGTSNVQKTDAEAKIDVKPMDKPSSAISVNTSLPNQPPDIVSPQKPNSLYEPYWRSHRYGRQRLVNGEASAQERSLSPPIAGSPAGDTTPTQITAKRNYMLRVGSVDGETTPTMAQSKNDPGRLDISWPPQHMSNNVAMKSPGEDNKDSGLGTDSPSTSTTDSRASSSLNAAPPTSISNSTSTSADWAKMESNKVENDHSNVAFMTKEEASVLLSPSTRDVVLRDTRGRVGDDGEIRSLPSHLSIPQDVDLKRLSMCSMDSSSEHGGLTTDRYSIPEDMHINVLPDGHFWVEVAGLEEEPPPSPSESMYYKKPSRVKFTTAPIKVFSTYTGLEYDRRNDDVDPVSASAEYELERRLEKMDIIEIELQKGPEGLGFSIIGMGVGADAGLEKLGIFVKSITPGGAVHRDGRICVCDQIVEVDGKSLVGVSQNYAASVLRSTTGIVRFKVGREKDLDNSEIAALIRQSLEQDRLLREQEELFQRRLNGSTTNGVCGNLENGVAMEMQENPHPHDPLPQYHRQQFDYLLAPPDRGYPWNGHRSTHESPLPSTDSVFARDDDDQTPEQLVDNPQIDQLMTQLREPPVALAPIAEKSKSESSSSGSTASDVFETQKKSDSADVNSQTAFRNDAQSSSSSAIANIQPTYTAAEDISRLLNESVHSEDLETRFPSNGSEPETVYNATVQPSFTTFQTQRAVEYGQLRRTTPDLSSSTDSMNGSEIQLRINGLESELGDIRRETDKYQTLLNDSKMQYDNLEKKYGRARKLIKDYQDREKDLLDRESEHLRQLREKDQQYANLVLMLKGKIVELEKQLNDAHRKRASIVESQAAAALLLSAANQQNSNASQQQPASDISPALAYQPAKKFECTITDGGSSVATSTFVKLPSGPMVRNIPIIRQPSLTSSEVDGVRNEKKFYGPDFGVPETELLDSTAAKSKAEVVKQSQVMASRALPTRRRETEVFIMCHHTLENAHSLRAHASGSHCGAGMCNNAAASSCSGQIDCSRSSSIKTSSPSKSSSNSGNTESPSTPRRLTARAALLLRKKASVNHATSAASCSHQTRHLESNSTTVVVGGGDFEKVPAVLTWTCDDVCRFLKSIGLEKYTPEFSINRVDGCKLLQLDGSRLKAMGVQNHSDRALIKKQIKEMKAQIERERKQLEKESRRLLKLEKDKRHQLARP